MSGHRYEKALGFIYKSLQAAGTVGFASSIPASVSRPRSECLSRCSLLPGSPSVPHSSQRIQSPGGLWAPTFLSAVPSWAPQSGTVEEEAACHSLQQGEGWLPPQPPRPPGAILGP